MTVTFEQLQFLQEARNAPKRVYFSHVDSRSHYPCEVNIALDPGWAWRYRGRGQGRSWSRHLRHIAAPELETAAFCEPFRIFEAHVVHFFEPSGREAVKESPLLLHERCVVLMVAEEGRRRLAGFEGPRHATMIAHLSRRQAQAKSRGVQSSPAQKEEQRSIDAHGPLEFAHSAAVKEEGDVY